MKPKLKQAIKKAGKNIYQNLPVIFGVILLISLVNTLVPKSVYGILFSKNIFLDSVIGSALGSILVGNPVTSYILGGELLKQGISLVAVTAFLVAWITVGVVQFPAEASILGKKFALTRNISAFVFSIIVGIITVLILGVL